jgi:hypothetical protein
MRLDAPDSPDNKKAGCNMKVILSFILSGAICTGSLAVHAAALAQMAAVPQSDAAALKAEIEALKRLVPSQSHAMADVDYHFSNLWFAAQSGNWPLSEFYLNETRSHLNWAVRIRPVRKLSSGQEFDLRPLIQGIENSSLAELKFAIDRKNLKSFDAAYRQAITECYACHKLAEKPYLRPRIPATPASRMIDMRPNTD